MGSPEDRDLVDRVSRDSGVSDVSGALDQLYARLGKGYVRDRELWEMIGGVVTRLADGLRRNVPADQLETNLRSVPRVVRSLMGIEAARGIVNEHGQLRGALVGLHLEGRQLELNRILGALSMDVHLRLGRFVEEGDDHTLARYILTAAVKLTQSSQWGGYLLGAGIPSDFAGARDDLDSLLSECVERIASNSYDPTLYAEGVAKVIKDRLGRKDGKMFIRGLRMFVGQLSDDAYGYGDGRSTQIGEYLAAQGIDYIDPDNESEGGGDDYYWGDVEGLRVEDEVTELARAILEHFERLSKPSGKK